MSADWPRLPVVGLQSAGILLLEDGNHGEYRPRQEEFGSGDWAFIRAADMNGGRVLFESAQKINDTAFRRIRKGVGKGGDVLFSHKGTVGKLALVPLDAPPFVCSPQTTFWRTLDERQLDRRYLYYFMQSRAFWEQWTSRKAETDMADYVSLTAQRTFHVIVPPIDQQRAIADVLGALDNKIEHNRRASAALERLARTIFRAWFVDFEPVKARAAAATSFPSVPKEIFEAMPTRVTGSELGLIPEGWLVKPIGDVVSVKGGATPSTVNPEYWDGGTHCWATPKDLSRLSDPVLLDTERRITDAGVDCVSSGLLPVGTVLLSSRAPVGYLAIAAVPTAVNQGFIAMVCNGPLPPVYILNWAETSMDAIKGRASGTTFPEISKTNFRPLPIVIPPAPIVSAYRTFAEPLFALLTATLKETAKIGALRDYLLPRLLSGSVRPRL